MRIWNGRSQFSLEVAGIGHKVKFRDGGDIGRNVMQSMKTAGNKSHGASNPV